MNIRHNNSIGLVWLHNDLRLHDNATVYYAAQSCQRLVFLYAPTGPVQSHGQSYYYNAPGIHRQHFLEQSLSDLALQLRERGNTLLVIPDASVADLSQFIDKHNISDIYLSCSSDYDHNTRHQQLAQQYSHLRFHEYATESLFAELPTLTFPRVFSTFRQQVERDNHLLRNPQPLAILESPNKLPPPPSTISNSDLHWLATATANNSDTYITGGERAAQKHIAAYFSSDAPAHYKATRNELDIWSSSTKLSSWLARGCVSARSIIAALRTYEANVCRNDSTYWIWFELLWREYFHWYAREHQHKLFTFKGITPCKRRSCFYGERYERWKNGNTPYPIVNACMNQLRETGYISNRGRQLAASCFIHELGMDWRYGASYFEQQLMDYDVASNWGNWQYIAGVGADPRGGRQFNLKKQTQQYDPDGKFIKAWNGDVGSPSIDSVDAADWPIM